MPTFELVEQAEIDADTSQVFKALLDMNNWSVWWPGHLNKIRGDEKIVRNGSVVDVKVRGYAPIAINLVEKIIDIVENKSIKVEWEGDLVGSVEWTLEAINGRTLARFHIKARSNRLLITFFSLFLSPTEIFSKVMQSGFKGLRDHLKDEDRFPEERTVSLGKSFLQTVKKEGFSQVVDRVIMVSCLWYLSFLFLNLVIQQVALAYIGVIVPFIILLLSSVRVEKQFLLKRLMTFGAGVAILYPLIENVFAPLTSWGYYVTNDPQLGITPLYIPFSFVFFIVVLGYASFRMFSAANNRWVGALVTGVLTFAANFLVEKISLESKMWIFNQFTHHIWNVPLFIPLTYAITFSTLPYLIQKDRLFGPWTFSLSIGFFWYVIYLIFEILV